MFKTTGSKFTLNSGVYGGAMLLQNSKVYVLSSAFTKNSASKFGGAIYSSVKTVSSSGCTYSKNTALKGKDVYGVFNVKVTQYKSKSGKVKIKITLTSPWKMPISQKVKLTFKGTKTYATKWIKTNSNGELILKVAKNLKFGKSYLKISMEVGSANIKNWNVVDTSIIYYIKTVKKPTPIKLTIRTQAYKKLIKNTKFKIKIYTGNKYKTVTAKTDSKGVMKLSTKKLSIGSHKIIVILNNSKFEINNQFKIKIIK